MKGDDGRGVEGAETAIDAVRINSTKACKLRLIDSIVGRRTPTPLAATPDEVVVVVVEVKGGGGIEWVGTKKDLGSYGGRGCDDGVSSSRSVG